MLDLLLVWVARMYWPKTGTTYYHTHIGLPDKGYVICMIDEIYQYQTRRQSQTVIKTTLLIEIDRIDSSFLAHLEKS